MVDELAGRSVERHEHGGDEPGGTVHITVSTCEQKQSLLLWKKTKATFIYSKNSNINAFYILDKFSVAKVKQYFL